MLERIMIPQILSEEEVILEYENVKELKLNFPRVVKKDKYYLVYSFEEEKDIDAVEIYRTVKIFYKNVLFYFIEKKEEEFLIFGGHTFNLDKTTFFYRKLYIDKIDNLKQIHKINKNLYPDANVVLFNVNLEKDDIEYIKNNIFDNENIRIEDYKKAMLFVFPSEDFSLIQKYYFIFLALILATITYFGYSYVLSAKKHEIFLQENKILNQYASKIEKLKKENKKLQKEIERYSLPKNLKIFHQGKTNEK